MRAFFRKLGGFLTGLRVWTVNLLTLIVLVYVVGAVWMIFKNMPGEVDPEGKVLILAPEGAIVEQEVYPSELTFPFGIPDEPQIQSRDLIRLIQAAAEDERLQGVVLDFSKASLPGPSTALRLAAELSNLRDSGKPVIAYSEALSTTAYMMAAQASEIYVHPSGAVAVTGIGGYRNYTRELTDKLKISVHNYSQGDYKSAVEGFTRTDMSEPDRRQREELYGPIWTAYKARMGSGRGLDPELFQTMADTQPVLLASEAAYGNLAWAEEQGVIDGTRSFPEFRAAMIERFGRAEDEERETYPHITGEAYLAQLPPEEDTAEDAIAVVTVEGGIQPGPMGPGVAGSDDLARLLRRAHEDESTRAVVLRVNSPGGSIIASDTIRDELRAAKVKGLPVVVSMGDVAASGGVWVSTPADRIYAEPTTITGSIGVAVAFPTLENVFDYLGVRFDGVTTSKYAGWSVNRPVTEEMDAIFARWAGDAYDRFINIVASSRNREPDYIRSIAGGRVWIAEAALERGLVDELGTVEDALAAAAELASLEDYRVNHVVKEPSPGFLLLKYLDVALGTDIQLPYADFSRRVSRLMAEFEGLSRPRATVLCTSCLVELQ